MSTKAKTTKTKTTPKITLATPLLASMSLDELTGVATALNVPQGKTAKATIANLETAIADGKAHVKAVFTISFKPEDGSASRQTYFGKTMRNYVTHGIGDQTWLKPENAAVGSPSEPTTEATDDETT